MSKKVAILEGDKSRRFGGVKYLRTTLTNGNTCEWVPESERKLTTKTVKKNGTYKIADEKPDKNGQKYYGFSQFTVNVKNSTTGKKKPSTGGDGNEYSVKTDEDGNLVETVLPSSIDITTQPSKTTYQNGENISISGAVVKAYKEDGTLWESNGYSGGVIPHGELTLEPDTASGGGGGGVISGFILIPQYTPSSASDKQGVISNGYTHSHNTNNNMDYAVTTNKSKMCLFAVGTTVYAACSESGGEVYSAEYDQGSGGYQYVETVGIEVEYGGAYYHSLPGGSQLASGVPTYNSIAEAIEAMEAASGGSETITVKWNRPEDDEELTTSFNITVT